MTRIDSCYESFSLGLSYANLAHSLLLVVFDSYAFDKQKIMYFYSYVCLMSNFNYTTLREELLTQNSMQFF